MNILGGCYSVFHREKSKISEKCVRQLIKMLCYFPGFCDASYLSFLIFVIYCDFSLILSCKHIFSLVLNYVLATLYFFFIKKTPSSA